MKSLWFQQRQKTCAFPVQCSRPLLAAIWLLGLVIWGGLLPSSVDAQDCRLVVDKSASPTTVDAGGVVEVTLTVRSDGLCTSNSSPIDVMLVLDRSGSMSGTRMQDAQNAEPPVRPIPATIPHPCPVSGRATTLAGTFTTSRIGITKVHSARSGPPQGPE